MAKPKPLPSIAPWRGKPRKIAVILPKRPDSEQFAKMAARAGKGGHIIGSREKQKRG
jgi:hypothetical protein